MVAGPVRDHRRAERSVNGRADLAAELTAALRRHVMDTWFPRCIDSAAGGYRCAFDRRWRPGPDASRLLEFQARQTRAAATLASAYPHESRWAEYALHGFRYLRDRMWDHEHGGWFRRVDRDGRALDGATKHAHGSAYAVQACARVFRATGERGALEHGAEGLDWWMRHGHDPDGGGFHGWTRRDGSVIRAEEDVPVGLRAHDPLGHAVGCKDVNVLGDWFETLLDLHAVAPSVGRPDLEAELLDVYVEHATTPSGAIHHLFRPDWTPLPGREHFGYAFQAAHRMLRAAPTSGREDELRIRARALIDRALARGRVRGGGFAVSRDPGAARARDVRESWVQFEALRALVARAGTDGGAALAPMVGAHWSFIRDQVLDPVHGGVFWSCPDDLPVRARRARVRARRKGDAWKDASHETDALLDAIGALRGAPPRPR
jgi:mannobiose 2-epimerase